MDQLVTIVATFVVVVVTVRVLLWLVSRSLATQQSGGIRASQEIIGKNIFAYMRVSKSSEEQIQQFQFEGRSTKLHKFVTEIVIPSAEEQRNKWQFATMMLLTAKEMKEFAFCYKPSQSGGQPILYESETFSPESKMFNNFIIARPKDNIKHAEAVILDNFDQLWVAYKTKNYNQTPASIILYSWIMPCNDCTEAIIKKLSTLGIPVTIVYTIPWTKESDQIQEKSRNRLKENQITVDRVNCPYRLQPKSQ